MTRDEVRRAAILLGLILAIIALAAAYAPCDGSCTVADEVRYG